MARRPRHWGWGGAVNRISAWLLGAIVLGGFGVAVYLSSRNSSIPVWLAVAGPAGAGIVAAVSIVWTSRSARKLEIAVNDGLTANNTDGSAEVAKRNRLHESLLADGNTMDTRYRYQRLLYASLQPAQTAAVALAAVAPVAI